MAAAKPRKKPARPPRYAVTTATKNGARRTILKGLIGYNRDRAPHPSWRSFAVVLNDSEGKVLGGLSGMTGWGWMYIELFWLPETLRRKGHGRKLMQMAEAEARRRGCVGIHLNTASFQAPDFYLKLGYEVFAVINDYPPGHKNYYLLKRLNP